MLSKDCMKIWIKKAKRHMPRRCPYTVYGYVRKIEDKGLSFTIPMQIIILILVYTFYYEAILSMLNLLKSSITEHERTGIMDNATELLNSDENWELSIINHIGEFAHEFLDKAYQTCNEDLATLYIWLLSTAEHQCDIHVSVIMMNDNDPLNKIFRNMDKWSNSYLVLTNHMNLFANIAATNDLSARNKLIEGGVLDELRKHTIIIYDMNNYKFNSTILEFVEMISLTIKNLTHKKVKKLENGHKYSKIFCELFAKLCSLNKYFHFKHKQQHHQCISFYYEVLLEMIELSLANTTLALAQMMRQSYSLMDILMNELTQNDRLLTKCIELLSYPNSRTIRHYLIRVFIYIASDTSSLHIESVMNYGLMDKIYEMLNSTKFELKCELSKIERSNLLLLLSKMFDCDSQFVIVMMRNDEIIQTIFDHLQIHYKIKSIKKHALTCLNNAFAQRRSEISSKLITFNNGLIINILCLILNDNADAKSICKEMKCIHYIMNEIRRTDVNKELILQRLKKQNILQILKKFQFIKEEEDLFCVDEQYLTKLGFKECVSDLIYLLHLIVKKE